MPLAWLFFVLGGFYNMKKKFKVVGSLTWIERIVLIILPILVVILAMGIGRMVISPVEF